MRLYSTAHVWKLLAMPEPSKRPIGAWSMTQPFNRFPPSSACSLTSDPSAYYMGHSSHIYRNERSSFNKKNGSSGVWHHGHGGSSLFQHPCWCIATCPHNKTLGHLIRQMETLQTIEAKHLSVMAHPYFKRASVKVPSFQRCDTGLKTYFLGELQAYLTVFYYFKLFTFILYFYSLPLFLPS